MIVSAPATALLANVSAGGTGVTASAGARLSPHQKAAAASHSYQWPEYKVIDTARVARYVLDRDEVPNCRLSTLAPFFGSATSPNHRALDDARATVDVLHGIFERLGSHNVTTLDQLMQFKRKRARRPLD